MKWDHFVFWNRVIAISFNFLSGKPGTNPGESSIQTNPHPKRVLSCVWKLCQARSILPPPKPSMSKRYRSWSIPICSSAKNSASNPRRREGFDFVKSGIHRTEIMLSVFAPVTLLSFVRLVSKPSEAHRLRRSIHFHELSVSRGFLCPRMQDEPLGPRAKPRCRQRL